MRPINPHLRFADRGLALRALLGWLLAALAAVVPAAPTPAAELVLSDFNGTGFDFTFDDFQQTIGPTAVRLASASGTDGWGGGGLGLGSVTDLTSLADGRWVVDLTVNPGSEVSSFTLETYDTSDRSGKWTMNVSSLAAGVPTQLVSATTIANPTGGVGDWENLDLGQISRWNILGEWASPASFDISFDRVAMSTDVAPPPPYPGYEPDAPWRDEATARIDAIRKADLTVRVTDAAGNPLPAADVGVHMQQHEFGFGAAVQAYRLRDSDPQHDMYKQKVAELFNVATIENNLKWPPWEGEWGSNFTQQGAQDAVAWLANQGIEVRGHNLIWPGYSNLPQSVQTILDGAPLDATEQQQLRDAIAAHIDDIAGTFAGQLTAWDVVNEPRANHDVMDNLPEGDQAMADWFQQARAADPNARLYLNEYGIITSGGGTDTVNQQLYYDTIEELKNNGAPIDGIGFQGHFSPGDLTGPEQLWAVFDRFDQLGLDMQITEFDIGTDDEELQAAYTRDFLTAVFAHEAVDDFLTWVFWEGTAWRPEAAMFRSDWSIKPNGQTFLDLVFGEWWTDEELAADELGEALVRAFKGQYEIEASFGDFSQALSVALADGGLELDVALPFLLGDYNGDGAVDAADYTVWRDALGQSVLPGTGADGNHDGTVDEADFAVWKAHFGATMPTGTSTTAVPEPASLCLVAIGVGCLVARRRFGVRSE